MFFKEALRYLLIGGGLGAVYLVLIVLVKRKVIKARPGIFGLIVFLAVVFLVLAVLGFVVSFFALIFK